MGRGQDNIFRPVKFEFGQVHIAGGFTTKPAAAKSKTVEGSDRKQHIFVKMAANEHWLLTATCGSGDKNRSAFSRTSLLTILREHIMRLADGSEALDATPVAEAEDYDPMSEIGSASATDRGGNAMLLPTDRQGRVRYYKNRAKNCIVAVTVASRCQEIDPICTQMRPVKLYITDRKVVWLSLDDVAWAIRYLFDQHRLKGVPLVDDTDAGLGGAVVESVPEGP